MNSSTEPVYTQVPAGPGYIFKGSNRVLAPVFRHFSRPGKYRCVGPGLSVDRPPPTWYIPDMTTTLFTNGRSQAVRIPKELRFDAKEVSIRRLGDGVLLVPVKASTWPEGFFERIRIDDANFARPEQGELPSIVEFSE
jgi:antitoxin VapB